MMKTNNLTTWLLDILNNECRDAITGVYGKKFQNDAIDSYINDLDSEGYLEVNGYFTKSGKPEINFFPELT